MQVVPVVASVQDIPSLQSGVRKNMNKGYGFAVIVRFGFLVTDYVAYVAANDFVIIEGTRKNNEIKICSTSWLH